MSGGGGGLFVLCCHHCKVCFVCKPYHICSNCVSCTGFFVVVLCTDTMLLPLAADFYLIN